MPIFVQLVCESHPKTPSFQTNLSNVNSADPPGGQAAPISAEPSGEGACPPGPPRWRPVPAPPAPSAPSAPGPQVASQFNCLEMVGPHFRPEDGITRYSSARPRTRWAGGPVLAETP